MKILRRAISVLLTFAVVLTFFVFPASAASVIEWDGKSEMEYGNTYIVTQELKVRNDFTVPEGVKLSVKSGGNLMIVTDTAVTVEGNFAVAIGGTVTNSGRFTVTDTGELNIYGEFLSSISAILKIKGKATVYNQGVFKISSETSLFGTGSIYCKGKTTFLKSSQSKFSGAITVTSNGEMHFQGKAAVTLSGSVDCSGYISVGKIGTLLISGTVTLQKNSDYNRFGDVQVTMSGALVDKREAVSYTKMTIATLVDEPDVHLNGIDVSYAQGDIDWAKVAASGIDFAIIRAGRGNTNTSAMKVDDYFVKNITEASANGIDVGVYFYSYASTVEEAREEAKFFVDIIKGYKITYPIILDMEEEFQTNLSKQTLTDMIDAFFKVVMNANYYPMFYSYKYWIEYNLDMRILDKYAVWLAQVSDSPTYDGAFYMWQYSFTGKINGIKGTIDLDVSYRDFPSILKKNKLNNL